MSDQDPAVSIVIPTYNSRRFLATLKRGLEEQTCTDWQAVIIDNGSTDGTWAVIEAWSQQDKRIHCIRKPHDDNPTHSRNLGISHARGRYVAFCDSDDYWHPQKLAFQLQAATSHPDASVIFTDRLTWSETAFPNGVRLFSEPKFAPVSAHEHLYHRNQVTNSSAMVPRLLLEQVGRLDETLLGVDDYHVYLKLSTVGSLVKIEQPLTYCFVHEANLSHNRIFMATNLLRLAQALIDYEALPKYVGKELHRQAYKSLARAHLAKNPLVGAMYLGRSLLASITRPCTNQ